MITVTRETHETPEWAQELLTEFGGRNVYGEPNYRLVWGWSRLETVGGKWTDRDASGNVLREVIEMRDVPKYFPHDLWHVEKWMPPTCTERQWYEMTAETHDGVKVSALGAYPSRGEYEHCFAIKGLKGEFVQVTPTILRRLTELMRAGERHSRNENKQALKRREDAKERAWDRRADDILDDAVPAFHGQVFV